MTHSWFGTGASQATRTVVWTEGLAHGAGQPDRPRVVLGDRQHDAHAAHEVVVDQHGRNGDQKARGGREERLGDAGRDHRRTGRPVRAMSWNAR